jgi:uncharacterized protein (TIGR03083 family)
MDAVFARHALEGAVERFGSLVRSAEPSTRVRGSDWTVAEVAAHVLTIASAYEGYIRDDIQPVIRLAHVNEDNARNLAQSGPVDVADVLDAIERATAGFVAATADLPLEHPMRWHDVTSNVGTVYGIFLGELLIHGRDIARTLRRPWSISRPEALLIFEAITGVAKWFVNPKRAKPDATFQLSLRRGPTYAMHFADGALTVENGRARHADCRIWGDPRALVLVIYKRRSQWSEITRGRLIAGGRRPWLAISFVKRFSGF